MHQGRILRQAIEDKNLSQEEAALKLGYKTRTNFTRFFKEETLKVELIDKAVNILGIDKTLFQSLESIANDDREPYNRAFGVSKDVRQINTYSDCMSELLSAHKQIIVAKDALLIEKERTINLQQQLIDLSKKY